jgi:prepilin-type N-terminal cleavage/methylation domain-containing protein
MRPTPNREAGYSLIETLIAMAILGSVLMGILSLFFFGRKNVYSGKQMTRAVAVGTRVMEDLTVLTREDMERGFALSTAGTPATLSTVTIAGKSYQNSILRASSTTTNPPDVDGYLGRWNALVAQQNFTNGVVSLVITPVDPRIAPTIPTLITAPIYRVRVIVQWNEEARRRSVVFDTTKLDRRK